jgi:hypothetical protein
VAGPRVDEGEALREDSRPLKPLFAGALVPPLGRGSCNSFGIFNKSAVNAILINKNFST